jgi:hypothetical protein
MNPYAPPEPTGTPYTPPPVAPAADPQQARSRILVPAIILAILSGLLIGVFALDLVLVSTGGLTLPATTTGPLDTAMPGFFMGVCIFAMVVNAGVLFAMVQMMRLRTWGLAFAGCIVSALPICSSACCLLTLPFAIWAIVVLLKPEVKAAFQ